MGALVSISQIAAEPFADPVPIYLPVGSKRAKMAEAKREVCTAVGCVILKGPRGCQGATRA